MAAQCLAALDVPCTSAGVAGLLADLLDGWLVDDADLAATRADLVGSAVRADLVGTDLLMRDVPGAGRLAGETLAVALRLRDGATGRGGLAADQDGARP